MIASAFFVVVPLVAVIVVLGVWVHDTASDESLRVQQQSARVVESEVRSKILDVESQLVLLDEVLALGTIDPDDQKSTLQNLLARNRIYQDLRLVAVDGTEVASASRSGLASVRGTDPPGTPITSVIETGDTYFGPVAFDQTLREPLSTIGVPIHDVRSGTVDYVLVASVRFKQIWALLADVARPGDSVVYVVNADGLVVAHANPAVVLRGTEIDLPATDGRDIGLSGESAVIATAPLRVGARQLTVVAEQSTSTAMRVADRAVEVVVVVTLLGLAVAITLVVLAVRLIIRPIERLAVSADTITLGDLSHRADEEDPGEVGHLARSFNKMTDRLGLEIESLEDRVRQRTAELEDAALVQAELIDQLEHQAKNDFLTGLPNRYSLEHRLEIELARARRLETRVALMLLDLDDFKGVNDTFGHGFGDQLLVAVGERLQENVRSVDAVCRLGGDEFAIVQPDVADRDHAASLAERLLVAFTRSFSLESQTIFTGLSIGVAVSGAELTSVSEFMRQADLALYRAKGDGRSTYRFFEDEMDSDTRRRVTLAQDLRGAIERDELFLEYQPQVSAADRRIVGVEALVRWRHPALGIVDPDEMVPIAEAAGMIEEVGEWVLRTACAQAACWRDDGIHVLPVAVNVSALQARDARFADKVARILRESELEPRYLELEITETVLIEAKQHVGTSLRALHQLGVSLSLDDFGRGYASLDYVRRYPLAKIKIDRSFVRDMMTNEKSAAIVGAVIDLAAQLGLMVVAEGVEHIDLLERLEQEGCEAIQGFFFSRPIPPEEIRVLVTAGTERLPAAPATAGVPDGVGRPDIVGSITHD